MNSGIYMIKNTKTNHVYIGQSVNLSRRIRRHKQELRDGIHKNDYLQKHYNKYGIDKYVYEIIESCPVEELDARECFWINRHNSMNRSTGYNLESGGNPGKIISMESRSKKMGKHNPMYGKKWNEKQRKNITLANRANSKILTEEDVADIKVDISEGASQKEIAEKYNLHISTVSKITRGVNWSWVKPELNESLRNYKDRNNEEVIKMFKDGVTRKQISREVKIDYRKINRILTDSGLLK
ncbi:GIY-YIG nuclease family protein [Terrihalobacillus insolitus]|uniref:GIY-YIG nuclease family protein n=1 Tax=Terrihalobacillus insolitus TaxID=2950438 RepID=UPI002341CFAB|nr:GIY-YIG nuclease family protein [Terrihalobacillus insolitus]MDC3414278.1 GIY-YIG nuclease family protein [Terrihalobacillus insolitus]